VDYLYILIGAFVQAIAMRVFLIPGLMVSGGISGAAQHIAGMATAGKVIAVNSDPKAPIFDYADLAIVGDWREVAEALLNAL